jgi:hypothetical protein
MTEWCALLPTLSTVTELEFTTRVNQPLFEAACAMTQLTSLCIKWSGIKALDSIANLTRLASLRIGSSGSIESIEPIASRRRLVDLELETSSASLTSRPSLA